MKNQSSDVRRAEILTTASSCCGVTGETVLTDSAIILLYASSMGAGNTGALFSTSVLPLFNGLAVIPMAGLAPRIGVRKLTLAACAISAIGYLIAGLAPFFGGADTILWGVSCAALVQAGFIAGWFPLLNSFIQPENRVSFLGRMRFFHQLSAAVFIFLAGLYLGSDPGAGKLQTVVLTAAIIFCGRFFCIIAVPHFPLEQRKTSGSWRENLKQAAANPVLRKFSLFQCLFNFGSFGLIPLSLLYMKHLGVPDNITVFISGASFTGMMLGYWFIRHLTEKIAVWKLISALGVLCLPACSVFWLLRDLPGNTGYVLLTLSLVGASFAVAAFSVVSSAVMMSCAPPDNAPMTMAFTNSFYYGSAGLTRLFLAWIAGLAWFDRFHDTFFGNGFCLLFFFSGAIMVTSSLLSALFLRQTATR
ncbi:MAG: MFS transporter [Lentisphaerae bacterium]|nr:MFS transporter [Lentisphaerota bacterium]